MTQANADDLVERSIFNMLWNWFEDESRIGAAGMRPERLEGLSADDFKTMLDEHEAALTSECGRLRSLLAVAEARNEIARKALEDIARFYHPNSVCGGIAKEALRSQSSGGENG